MRVLPNEKRVFSSFNQHGAQDHGSCPDQGLTGKSDPGHRAQQRVKARSGDRQEALVDVQEASQFRYSSACVNRRRH